MLQPRLCRIVRLHVYPPRVRTYMGPPINTRFQPFVPPPPSSLPKPKPPAEFSPRTLKILRRLFYTAGALGTFWAADHYLNYATFTRNLRTIAICSLMAADYKLNFRQGKDGSQLSAIHERNADRVLELCFKNGGLYQKIGQAIAMQSAILPPVVQQRFTAFFDETPQASWKEVERTLQEEFGDRFPGLSGAEIADRLFVPGSFERRAVGSASIAQVHKARLPTGEEVAVKIQKPWIKRQVGWDLAVFRGVTYRKNL
jgi:aarF domain-containing kinase